ncbi:MAG: hypothetical protein JXQ27_14540 [Acidobacteria bacterium]|nr:hypothetical protein [Acidobacteriota bacterium]
MPGCHDMKKAEIYVCPSCGLELEVKAECRNAAKPAADCGCHDHEEECRLTCCGVDLIKK